MILADQALAFDEGRALHHYDTRFGNTERGICAQPYVRQSDVPTSTKLECLDRHQRLIDSCRKLHTVRATVYMN